MVKFKKFLKNVVKIVTLDKPTEKVFNKVSGREKIKKIATQQKEQQVGAINAGRQEASTRLAEQYQHCVAEIAAHKAQLIEAQNVLSADKEEIINYIYQIKASLLSSDQPAMQNNFNLAVTLLDQHATEIAAQYAEVIREIMMDIETLSLQQEQVEQQQHLTAAALNIITQELPTKLDAFAEQLAARYEEVFNNNQDNLEELERQEASFGAEYSQELANLNKQYNDAIEKAVQQIESWRKKTTKKATKNFVIQVAAGVVANWVAPGISASFQVTSKCGMAAVKAASFSSINSLATAQLKSLPKTLLKNVAASAVHPLVSHNIVAPLQLADAAVNASLSSSISNGLLAATSGNKKWFSSMVAGGLQAYAGTLLEEQLTSEEEASIIKPQEAAATETTEIIPTINELAVNNIKQPNSTEIPDTLALKALDTLAEPLNIVATEEPIEQALDSSATVVKMQKNADFQPLAAPHGHIIEIVDQAVGPYNRLASRAEFKQAYAWDIIRKQQNPHASVGITPFFGITATSVPATPGFPVASAETEITAGINIVKVSKPQLESQVDVGRVDVAWGSYLAEPNAFHPLLTPAVSSSASLEASAVSITAQVGPVKMPFVDLKCYSNFKAGLLNYDSTGVVPLSLTKVSSSVTCYSTVAAPQNIANAAGGAAATNSLPGLRP